MKKLVFGRGLRGRAEAAPGAANPLPCGTLATGQSRDGSVGSLAFKTVLRGIIGPSAQPGTQRGSVMWEVTSGEGKLQGAQGLITSNFTVSANGDVTYDQFVRLWLP